MFKGLGERLGKCVFEGACELWDRLRNRLRNNEGSCDEDEFDIHEFWDRCRNREGSYHDDELDRLDTDELWDRLRMHKIQLEEIDNMGNAELRAMLASFPTRD